jgi:hypothetical protein
MEPLFEFCEDNGEEVYHGSNLIEEVFQQGFEVRDVVGLLLGLIGRWYRRRGWCSRKILRGDLGI